MDDLYRLRIAEAASRRPDSGPASSGAAAFIGKVTTPTWLVGTFLMVNPVVASGAETEGGAAVMTVPDATVKVPVYLVGPSNARQGDLVVCRRVDHRWVAERMSGGAGTRKCPPSLHFQLCDGSPIAGATITVMNNGVVFATGTTDASGNYVFPATGYNQNTNLNSFGISYDGLSGSYLGIPVSGPNCDNVYCLRYDKAVVTVTTVSGATIRDDSFLTWTSIVTSGGTTTYTYKEIRPCFNPAVFPKAGCFTASLAGYIPYCLAPTITCNANLAVNLPLFDYRTDYWGYDCQCDTGCANCSTGSSCDGTIVGGGPNRRGVFPKVLFATWRKSDPVAHPNEINCPFDPGGLAGVAVRCVWNGTIWTSGCLANVITQAFGSNLFTCARSSKVTIGVSSGGQFYATFLSYLTTDCTGVESNSPCGTGIGCAQGGGDRCLLTAPVDVVSTYVHITQ